MLEIRWKNKTNRHMIKRLLTYRSLKEELKEDSSTGSLELENKLSITDIKEISTKLMKPKI